MIKLSRGSYTEVKVSGSEMMSARQRGELDEILEKYS